MLSLTRHTLAPQSERLFTIRSNDEQSPHLFSTLNAYVALLPHLATPLPDMSLPPQPSCRVQVSANGSRWTASGLV